MLICALVRAIFTRTVDCPRGHPAFTFDGMAIIIASCGVDPTELDQGIVSEFSHPFEQVVVNTHLPADENGSRFDIRASAFAKEWDAKWRSSNPEYYGEEPAEPIIELHVHNLTADGSLADQVINLDDMSESETLALIEALQKALDQAREDALARGWKPQAKENP